MEVCAALGGVGPRFAGRVVSFEYATGHYSVMQLAPDENCSGHMRLVEGRDFLTVPHCSRPRSLAACVERRMGWDYRDITLTAERDIVRTRVCRVCARCEPIFHALVNYGASAACACGARDFDYDVGTEVLDMDGTLEAQGIPDGKAVVAHHQDHSIIAIRKELHDGLAQE